MIKDPIQKGQVGGEDLGGGKIGDRSQTWRIMAKWGEMARVLQGMVILQMAGNLFSRFSKLSYVSRLFCVHLLFFVIRSAQSFE